MSRVPSHLRGLFILIVTALIFQNCRGQFKGSEVNFFSGPSTTDDDDVFPDNPVPPGAKPVELSSGHSFLEGPAYQASTGLLYFSDIPRDVILTIGINPVAPLRTFRQNSSRTNGNMFDSSGNLISLEAYPRRRVVRTDMSSGAITVLASEYNNKKLNAPNDLDIFSDGSIYFTDPTYNTPNNQIELDFRGVFRVKNGELESVITSGFYQPNGIAFSPNYLKLYVSDSEADVIMEYDVLPNGQIENPNLFYDPEVLYGPSENGNVDGMTVDKAGNVYTTGDNSITIIRPNGKVLQKIEFGSRTTNCKFGGTDKKTLFVTGDSRLWKIDLLIPGK